jgi:hypothetical protein
MVDLRPDATDGREESRLIAGLSVKLANQTRDEVHTTTSEEAAPIGQTPWEESRPREDEDDDEHDEPATN